MWPTHAGTRKLPLPSSVRTVRSAAHESRCRRRLLVHDVHGASSQSNGPQAVIGACVRRVQNRRSRADCRMA
eukprot:1216128-Prymnesium_polylepis.1